MSSFLLQIPLHLVANHGEGFVISPSRTIYDQIFHVLLGASADEPTSKLGWWRPAGVKLRAKVVEERYGGELKELDKAGAIITEVPG